jgi:hypothetical protein
VKKLFIPLIAIALILVGFSVYRSSTYSAGGLPYPDLNPDPSKVLPSNANCVASVKNTGYLMRKAWTDNLNALLAQEKPSSEKVDDGYESLRTYKCWLDYLCEAVLYSTTASPNATLKDIKSPNSGQRPLAKTEIAQVPGCASPNGIEIPGVQLQYIPACSVGGVKTSEQTQTNFSDCRTVVGREFSGDPNGKSDFDPTTSLAFIALNNSLRADSADGEIKPMREKFSSILLKMLGMEDHMTTLKEQILALDKRLPCYVGKCD